MMGLLVCWETRGMAFHLGLLLPSNIPEIKTKYNLIGCTLKKELLLKEFSVKLKKRFPIIANCVRISLEKIPKLILEENPALEEEQEELAAEEQIENAVTKTRGVEKRQEIIQILF
ncbi:hypothetical protein J6590_049317 [Homalodisca vitripennis]|nr:hypothetical protein J6590_049317 [Homalodisca vitripennis]